MKKSSKIWKIEHYGIPVFDGMHSEYIIPYNRFGDDIQFIYESELDCVLDIATEPENHGLKVYKHQSKVIEEKDLESMKRFSLFHNKEPFRSARYYSEDTYQAGEVPKGYELYSPDAKFLEYNGSTQYHWVEVFMQ